MENEKLQDVSEETRNETPEEVQNEAELKKENLQEEVSEEKEAGNEQDQTHGDVESELADHPDDESQDKFEDTVSKEVEEVRSEQDVVPSEVDQDENLTASSKVEDNPETEAKANPEEKSEEDTKAIENDAHQEESEGEEEEQEEEIDLDNATKEQVLAKIKEVKNEENIRKLDRVLKAAKPRFDELYEFSKNEALQKFVSEGNEAESFEYHGDEADKEFIAIYGQLRAKRNKHYKDLESEKENNLKKKEHLLESLRNIVDGEESANSINAVRELQSEWKKVGPVPGAHNKTLWANYNALLDRYYDNRSIYFELKDLDRKKNMKQKEELCEKAEALLDVEDMKTAIIQLNELHEEYKHIGPVPQENQEALWQRFKAASDAIYARRKEYFEGLKVEFETNLIKKEELIKDVEQFTQFNSDRITEWNDKTKELLELQKKWEAIGGV
ncbi:MAG: DUF349 domain-containing protein, partial [Bacteroidota bacterium]